MKHSIFQRVFGTLSTEMEEQVKKNGHPYTVKRCEIKTVRYFTQCPNCGHKPQNT